MGIDRQLRVLSLRLRSLVLRRRVDRDLDDELRDHVESEVERQMAAGVERDIARRRALRQLGDLDRVKEACRETRGLQLLDTTAADVRYALRTLRRAPGFAAVAIAT